MPLRDYPRSTFVASGKPERVYSYLDVPASSSSNPAPPILFLHGFPDLAIGWSDQIDYFSSRGHRCIAPDMLGYGLTSRPSREEGRLGEYAIMSMSGDIASLVQHALGSGKGTLGRSSGSGSAAGKVIVISHDHGANFAWKFTHYHPDLVLGMVGLCVPYARITNRWASREVITQLIPTFGYQMFFEEERSSEIIQDQVSKQAGKGIEHFCTLKRSEVCRLGMPCLTPVAVCLVVQLETFLLNIYSKVGLFTLDPSHERTEADSPEFRGNLERLLLQAGKEGSASGDRDALGSSRSEKEKKRNDLIMDPEVFDYYMEQFGAKAGGIDGALNWYRTRKMNFDDEQSQCRYGAGIPKLRPPLTPCFPLPPGYTTQLSRRRITPRLSRCSP